jgi:transcriptional regulator with XRE-family HTH domain
MTQEDLADRAGLSVQSVSALENAKNYPALDTLVILSDILGFDIADVVSDPQKSESRFALETKAKSLLGRLDEDLLVLAVHQIEALFDHAKRTGRTATRTSSPTKK